jgi:hypothetical protein
MIKRLRKQIPSGDVGIHAGAILYASKKGVFYMQLR